MSPSPIRDLAVGLFVAAGLAAIGYLSLSLGGLSWSGPSTQTLYATFDDVGGLRPRASVRIGGVQIGEVEEIGLDADFRSRVTLSIDASLELPRDTSASILTEGLLGSQFLDLEPGADDVPLQDGAQIQYTQSALSFERLIGRLVQNFGVSK
ncbi:MAG: outer membrane lipid asymmetry maintenance protein MlaD [Myxococcota bacterium]